MLYSDLRNLIQRSAQSAWLFDGDVGILTLKDDVNVNIVRIDSEVDRPFQEDWTDQFPDKRAFRSPFELRYSGSFVERYDMISVDGGRYTIPLPTRDRKLSPYDHHIGKLLNSNVDRYEEGLSRAGITVE